MTAECSLKIIRETIEHSRKETTRNVGKPLLMWGILVFVTTLVVGLLLWQMSNANWQYFRFVFGIVGGLGQWQISRRTKAHVKNITSEIVGDIWISFAVFCFCTFFIAILALYIRQWVGYNGQFVMSIAPFNHHHQ